jgi:hypothetical protein
MRKLQSWSLAVLMSTAIAAPVLIAGCTAHVRYYDAEYSDYHPWNHDEVVFYGRWETETHRPHVDFARRNADEQKEYWHWRHQQH